MTIKFLPKNVNKIRDMAGNSIAFFYENDELQCATIQTKRGQITAMIGDNIVKYSNGEIYTFEDKE